LRAGLFNVEDILHLPIVGRCFAEVDAKYPGLAAGRRRHEALRRVFGVMVEDVLAESAGRLAEADAESAQDIRMLGQPVVQFSASLWEELKEIRAFLFGHMYRHETVKVMRVETAQVVRALFAAFMADPTQLPDDWRAEGELAQARKISDYIAGMTDRYALQLHAKF